MNPFELQFTAITHVVYSMMLRVEPSSLLESSDRDLDRDRGAVSIEQVLWYAAAAVSVAVVAKIIWDQVKGTADGVSPDVPAAP